MRKIMTFMCAVAMFMGATAQKSIYDFTVRDQQGQEVSMSQYKGKYLLVVNTATQCGFTPQYRDLEYMQEKYGDMGFVVLDFPCNQFGEQAPGSSEEIHGFCTQKYGITFPQFEKIDVNGENASPLFVWLKEQKGFEGFDLDNRIGLALHKNFLKIDPNYAESPDIKWNFTKFLIDKDGNVVKRYEPTTDMNVIVNDIYDLMFN